MIKNQIVKMIIRYLKLKYKNVKIQDDIVDNNDIFHCKVNVVTWSGKKDCLEINEKVQILVQKLKINHQYVSRYRKTKRRQCG